MNYNISEVHNSGIGEDHEWHNIEINDINSDQLAKIMEVVFPMYECELEAEKIEHEKWEKDHPQARTG